MKLNKAQKQEMTYIENQVLKLGSKNVVSMFGSTSGFEDTVLQLRKAFANLKKELAESDTKKIAKAIDDFEAKLQAAVTLSAQLIVGDRINRIEPEEIDATLKFLDDLRKEIHV